MKKALILSLLLTALTVTGCDFIRQVAGRPTAAQVEEIRQERLRVEAQRRQAREDSLARVRQHRLDSLAAREAFLQDSLSRTHGMLIRPARLGGLAAASRPEAQYSIVVAAFRTKAYADRKVLSCGEAGYPGSVLTFRNGLNAVALCPSDSLRVVMDSMEELRRQGLCPKEGWILVNE